MDLSRMSVDELRKLDSEVKKEVIHRRQQMVHDAKRQINEIANRVGIPLEELIGTKKQLRLNGIDRPIRYQHPDRPELSWKGAGRQPLWLKEWIAAGKSLALLTPNSPSPSLE